MQVIIVISMIFSVLIAFFAVQNAGTVIINLFWYEVSLSQAVVILCSALFGVLIMLPFDIARTIKNKLRIMELSGEIKRLKEELKKTAEAKEVKPEKPQAEEVVSVTETSNL
ncbi:MAG TPA: LapA family protein [Patescibacteria group bacterium]|nr:LapA family protein [Patescibacteria group bacterium]